MRKFHEFMRKCGTDTGRRGGKWNESDIIITHIYEISNFKLKKNSLNPQCAKTKCIIPCPKM